MQILILGMYRSGTSATGGLIHKMGAYFGPAAMALPASDANPKGFWERSDVNLINDKILALKGCEWDKVAGWNGPLPELPTELHRTMAFMVHHLNGHRPWLLKDPRLCLTLPLWLPLMKDPIAVMVYRDPREIAASLKTRDGMDEQHALALWESHITHLLDATKDLKRLFISHTDLIQTPTQVAQRLFGAFTAHGIRDLHMIDAEDTESFIDRSLYRSRPVAIELSESQQLLAKRMQGIAL